MQAIDLVIDVTAAADIGEAAHVAVMVTLPDPAKIGTPPIICFAKPGGGYSHGYYIVDLPGPARGAQADWHAACIWVFVSVDHLGGGNSSIHDAVKLDNTATAAGNMVAEVEVLRRLAEGSLADGFPAIADSVKIGIGQSMDGCMTIIQQGRYHCYDGIGVLGKSAIHSHLPVRLGTEPIVAPWLPRWSSSTPVPLLQPIEPGACNRAWLDAVHRDPILGSGMQRSNKATIDKEVGSADERSSGRQQEFNRVGYLRQLALTL